jgi:hypothetical protein
LSTLLNVPPVESPITRVLYCLVCDTLEELPLYDGDPEHDHLLAILVERHVFPSGEPHKGHLFRVPQTEWDREDVRRRMIEQIKGGGSKGIDEFDASYYATNNTFREDALKCYAKHLRPTDGCPDYKTDKMRLLPNTKAERRDAGLPDPKNAPGPKNYLCNFCPVQSVVDQKLRAMKGMYK